MKLITEISEDIEYITEGKNDSNKSLYIKGIFLQSGIKNRNGRVYPEQVMDKEVHRYIAEKVDKKYAFGELNHPPTPVVGLDRASHIITELKKDGLNWIGKAKIMETPMGNIVKGIIESGGRVGVSSRGMGSIKKNSIGINEVQSDFKLATAADVVSDPSAPDAFVDGIMEGVDWLYNEQVGNYQMINLAEEAKQKIENYVRSRRLEEQKLALFADFMNKVSKI